ncbi:helix-turn-helix domain-containing protein [Sphingopyxis flava]|uniref:DNA binding domain-containing protein, excisionase family n=1 Tax=Sphingopyxis flava TaxID=1507287 RepID=A0A1T5AD17_9SPHN|nr:helix-turn-helix domain-containing protein [Sphingopyxis flava]SKB32868.1 hypothetical protein SAMN06295937_1003120 [Sphingopyxis flava]
MSLPLSDLPDWPAALDADEAVKYTRVAPAEIARAARDGRLTFRPIGPNGRKVVRREELDKFLAALFAKGAPSLLGDMDFGRD